MGSGRSRKGRDLGTQHSHTWEQLQRERKCCCSKLIFPGGASSPHYSGRYLSNSRSTLVVQQLRKG